MNALYELCSHLEMMARVWRSQDVFPGEFPIPARDRERIGLMFDSLATAACIAAELYSEALDRRGKRKPKAVVQAPKEPGAPT
jgi:hypothetical protein